MERNRGGGDRKPRRRVVFWGSAAVVLLAGMALPAFTAGSRPPPREIVLVARGMAFYEEGRTTPNPTLRLQAGEQVRVVLRNAAPGVTHDFAIETWRIETASLKDLGEVSIVINVPRLAGRSEYVCSFHSSMMRGNIDVY